MQKRRERTSYPLLRQLPFAAAEDEELIDGWNANNH